MKKFIVMALVGLLCPLYVSAQLITSAQMITTEIEKEKPKKEKLKKEKKPTPLLAPVKPGFEQMVEASIHLTGKDFSIGAEYIAGYRFNNTFFLGGGIGLLFNTRGNDYHKCIAYGHLIQIPIFVHSRIYLTHTRVQPYIALSMGGMIEPDCSLRAENNVVYLCNCSSFFVAPGIGVNIRCNDKISAYITSSYMGSNGEIYYSHGELYSDWASGFRVNLGITF